MVMQILRSVFADLLADDSKIDTAMLTPSQEAVRNQRIKKYKIICFCGIGMMLWRGNTALFNKLHNINSIPSYLFGLYFAFALLCMILVVIASSFPDSAPCAMAISSNGALQAFLFAIASLHLSVMEFYTKEQHMIISVVVSSAVFTAFWCFCVRDPPELSKVTIKRS